MQKTFQLFVSSAVLEQQKVAKGGADTASKRVSWAPLPVSEDIDAEPEVRDQAVHPLLQYMTYSIIQQAGSEHGCMYGGPCERTILSVHNIVLRRLCLYQQSHSHCEGHGLCPELQAVAQCQCYLQGASSVSSMCCDAMLVGHYSR